MARGPRQWAVGVSEALNLVDEASDPMTFTLTNIGTAKSKSATSLTITVPAGGVPAGALIYVAFEGSSTPTAIGDTAGNTYSIVNGDRHALFAFNALALVSGDVIQVTFASGAAAVSACYARGAVWATSDPAVAVDVPACATNVFDFAGGSAPTATLFAAPAAAGSLCIGMIGTNGPSGDTFTQDAAWPSSLPTRDGTTGGSAGTNRTIAGGFRTASTAVTYAPTVTSRDSHMSILVFPPEVFAVDASEALTLSDAASDAAVLPSSVAEAVTLADAADASVVSPGSTYDVDQAEAISLSDAASSLASTADSAAEALALSDAASSLASTADSAAEAISLSDAASSLASTADSAAEALALSDAASSLASTADSAAEALALSDAASSLASTADSATEALALSDDADAETQVPLSAAEALTLSDAASSQADLEDSAAEALALSDVPSSQVDLEDSAGEALALSDAASSQADLEDSADEAVSLSDDADAETQIPLSADETMALSDGQGAAVDSADSAAEAMAMADHPSASVDVQDSADEALALSDAASSRADLVDSADEALALTDQMDAATGGNTYDEAVSEALALADSAAAGHAPAPRPSQGGAGPSYRPLRRAEPPRQATWQLEARHYQVTFGRGLAGSWALTTGHEQRGTLMTPAAPPAEKAPAAAGSWVLEARHEQRMR